MFSALFYIFLLFFLHICKKNRTFALYLDKNTQIIRL